jgi:hypothetical protein
LERKVGGAESNAAIALSRLGVPSGWVQFWAWTRPGTWSSTVSGARAWTPRGWVSAAVVPDLGNSSEWSGPSLQPLGSCVVATYTGIFSSPTWTGFGHRPASTTPDDSSTTTHANLSERERHLFVQNRLTYERCRYGANTDEPAHSNCGSEGRGFEPRRSPPEEAPWGRAERSHTVSLGRDSGTLLMQSVMRSVRGSGSALSML